MDSSNANGVPVVIFSQPAMTQGGAAAATHPYAAGRKALTKQLTILGSLQVAFGALLIVFQIVCVVLASKYYHHGFAFIGYGIWMGLFYVITGAFGCAAGRKNNRGFMITFNVMSIIAAALNTLLFTLAGLSIVILDFSVYYGYHRYYHDSDDEKRYNAYLEERRRLQRASIALESLMIIMALAEVIVAIWSSVVCCKLGACCCDCGDACCCPPAPVPTQVLWAQQPPIDGYQQQQQQQPMLVYASIAPNPAANDVFHENKHQKPFHYQQLMSDPNMPDGETGDHTRLCS